MSIFVSVAAYEDPTLERTLKQAIEKADNPDSLMFGICLQYTNEPNLSFIPDTHKQIIRFTPEERPGVNKVRYLLKQKFTHEDYFLQIDSHMQFEQSWDTRFIEQLKELKEIAGSNKVVISTPREVSGKDSNVISVLKTKLVEDDKFFVFRASFEKYKGPEIKFYKSNYIRCGTIFADKNFVKEINFTPYSHIFEEESYLTFQTIMLGWKIYEVPYDTLVWHSPEEYNEFVWSNKTKKLLGDQYQDNEYEMYEFNLAYIYNDYSKYAIKNAKLSPKQFWEEIKLADYYDKLEQKLKIKMYNNFIV